MQTGGNETELAAKPGRPPSLDREAVIRTALKIIDDQGLGGFTVRKLARALGVYPTAVYWYVPNRNALLAAVVDYALHDVLPADPSGDWRLWLAQLFRRFRRAVQRHPNLAQLTGSQLNSNSGVRAELVDQILTVLENAGFQGESLRHAYNVVMAIMVGFVTMEFATPPPGSTDELAGRVQQAFRSADPVAYPALARNLPSMENRAFVVRWQNGVDVPLDDSFDTYVEVAIRGLEQLAERVGETPIGGENAPA